MQTALNIAAYALGATMLAGVVLLGMLAYDLWWRDRFRAPRPAAERLPCTALEGAREVYDRMKLAYAKAPAAERRHLDVHLRRMAERVRYVEDKTFAEQDPYYKAVGRRDKLWRAWKALHGQVSQMSRADRQRSRHLLDDAASGFRKADDAVKEQWERGLYRDKLMQEELRALGLLDEDYLPKLLDQVRTHASHFPAEEAGWQEPGVEPEAEPGVASGIGSGAQGGAEPAARAEAAAGAPPAGQTLPQPAGADAGAQGGEIPSAHPAAAGAGIVPRGIGRLSYRLIRQFLAPLFPQKAAPGQNPPAPGADLQASPAAWQPTPPPPRVELPAPQPAAGTAGAAGATGAAAAAGAESPAVLRQQDVQGTGLAAPGRRYADAAFSVAGLPRGILRQADLGGGSFAGVRFTGRHRYLECRFTGADLSGIALEAQGRAHQFVRCDFSGARFAGSRLCFVLFHECDLSGSHWQGARLERVRFSDCKLDGVDWGNPDLVDTHVRGAPAPQPLASPAPPPAPPGATPDGARAAGSADGSPGPEDPPGQAPAPSAPESARPSPAAPPAFDDLPAPDPRGESPR